MTKDEALKLALYALEYRGSNSWRKRQPAITAIKETLASVPTSDTSEKRVDEMAKQRHEQDKTEQGRNRSAILGNNVEATMEAGLSFTQALNATLKVYDHPAQPEQEPVAWLIWLHGPAGHFDHKQFAEMEFERRNKEYPDPDRKLLPLYTAPPQPEPVIDKSAATRIATSLGWEPKRKPLEGVIDVQPIGYHSLQLIFRSQTDIAKFKAAHGIKE